VRWTLLNKEKDVEEPTFVKYHYYYTQAIIHQRSKK
ncbi:unnamed protein product, partial [Musa hybrid cultivar]